jgi:hypothetical protein
MIGSKREDVVGERIRPGVRWVLTFELFTLDAGLVFRLSTGAEGHRMNDP